MVPPWKALDTKAILPRFRAVAHSGSQSLPNSTRDPIHHVKEPNDSNNLPRFERLRGCTRHIAARKHRAGTEHF
jgi:hypothetical protein